MTDRRPTERAELLRALAVLAEPPTAEAAAVSEALGLGAVADSATYSDVFLFQLYPYASVHVGPEGMLGGEARGRVAGFWRAVGQTPPAEPDHLAALLGLYAGLLERSADGEGAESVLLRRSADALLWEHLAPWVFGYLDRVVELAGPHYGDWAELLAAVLREGLADAAGSPPADRALPRHLVDAPPLADPRTEGGAGFVEALLAPVRSGMTLTRADLARLASAEGLGLRAGERRYALGQLLDQDPVAMLRRLAEEASIREAEHRRRADWLGGIGRFFTERTGATAALLAALAEEGHRHLNEAESGSPVAGAQA